MKLSGHWRPNPIHLGDQPFAIGVVGEILYMQVVFNAGGFVAPRPGR